MEFEEFTMNYSSDISNLFLKFKEINKNNGFYYLNRKKDNSYDLIEFLYNHINVIEFNEKDNDLIISDEEY